MPSPNNMEDSFSVGDVTFDNHDGMGSTPNGRNVNYIGATVWIKPSTFRKLAIGADRAGDAKNLEELMRAGKPIATPWLILAVDGEPEDPKKIGVIGHEGRARADAFKAINGDVFMPVQLHPSGLRARHLSPEFFAFIEQHGIQAEQTKTMVKLNAQMYYWQGETIKP